MTRYLPHLGISEGLKTVQWNLGQGIVDGSASKPTLRQYTGYHNKLEVQAQVCETRHVQGEGGEDPVREDLPAAPVGGGVQGRLRPVYRQAVRAGLRVYARCD